MEGEEATGEVATKEVPDREEVAMVEATEGSLEEMVGVVDSVLEEVLGAEDQVLTALKVDQVQALVTEIKVVEQLNEQLTIGKYSNGSMLG